MLEKQRQHLLLKVLDEEGFARVKTLCDRLNASEATIRRDLVKLAKANRLTKIRGGAQSVNLNSPESKSSNINSSLFLVDKERNLTQKRLIAQKAVEMCSPGESIIINGGSSTFMMSEFLTDTKLNILTNSIVLTEVLWEDTDNQITLPGGEVYASQGIILSAFDNDSIPNYHCSKMFMGTPAINEKGVMESDTLLVRAEQKLLKQAKELIVLADSSKLGADSNFVVSTLEQIDVLITDREADKSMLALFESKGIEVVIAD